MNREDKIRPTLPFVQWKSIIKCLRNIAFYEYSRTAETCFLNILNSVKFETYCIYKIKLVEYVVLNVKFRTFSGKCSIGVRLQIPLHVPARLGHPLIPHPVVRNLRLFRQMLQPASLDQMTHVMNGGRGPASFDCGSGCHAEQSTPSVTTSSITAVVCYTSNIHPLHVILSGNRTILYLGHFPRSRTLKLSHRATTHG